MEDLMIFRKDHFYFDKEQYKIDFLMILAEKIIFQIRSASCNERRIDKRLLERRTNFRLYLMISLQSTDSCSNHKLSRNF